MAKLKGKGGGSKLAVRSRKSGTFLTRKDEAIQWFQQDEFHPSEFFSLLHSEKELDQARNDLALLNEYCKQEVQKVVHDHHKDFLESSRGIQELETLVDELRNYVSGSAAVVANLVDLPALPKQLPLAAPGLPLSVEELPGQVKPSNDWEGILAVQAELIQDLQVAVAEKDYSMARALLAAGRDMIAVVNRDAAQLASQVSGEGIAAWRYGLEGVLAAQKAALIEDLQRQLMQTNASTLERRQSTQVLGLLVGPSQATQALLHCHTLRVRAAQQLLLKQHSAAGGDPDGVEYAGGLAQRTFLAIGAAAEDVRAVFPSAAPVAAAAAASPSGAGTAVGALDDAAGDVAALLPTVSALVVQWATEEARHCAGLLCRHALAPFEATGMAVGALLCVGLALVFCAALESSHGLALQLAFKEELWPLLEAIVRRHLQRLRDEAAMAASLDATNAALQAVAGTKLPAGVAPPPGAAGTIPLPPIHDVGRNGGGGGHFGGPGSQDLLPSSMFVMHDQRTLPLAPAGLSALPALVPELRALAEGLAPLASLQAVSLLRRGVTVVFEAVCERVHGSLSRLTASSGSSGKDAGAYGSQLAAYVVTAEKALRAFAEVDLQAALQPLASVAGPVAPPALLLPALRPVSALLATLPPPAPEPEPDQKGEPSSQASLQPQSSGLLDRIRAELEAEQEQRGREREGWRARGTGAQASEAQVAEMGAWPAAAAALAGAVLSAAGHGDGERDSPAAQGPGAAASAMPQQPSRPPTMQTDTPASTVGGAVVVDEVAEPQVPPAARRRRGRSASPQRAELHLPVPGEDVRAAGPGPAPDEEVVISARRQRRHRTRDTTVDDDADAAGPRESLADASSSRQEPAEAAEVAWLPRRRDKARDQAGRNTAEASLPVADEIPVAASEDAPRRHRRRASADPLLETALDNRGGEDAAAASATTSRTRGPRSKAPAVAEEGVGGRTVDLDGSFRPGSREAGRRAKDTAGPAELPADEQDPAADRASIRTRQRRGPIHEEDEGNAAAAPADGGADDDNIGTARRSHRAPPLLTAHAWRRPPKAAADADFISEDEDTQGPAVARRARPRASAGDQQQLVRSAPSLRAAEPAAAGAAPEPAAARPRLRRPQRYCAEGEEDSGAAAGQREAPGAVGKLEVAGDDDVPGALRRHREKATKVSSAQDGEAWEGALAPGEAGSRAPVGPADVPPANAASPAAGAVLESERQQSKTPLRQRPERLPASGGDTAEAAAASSPQPLPGRRAGKRAVDAAGSSGPAATTEPNPEAARASATAGPRPGRTEWGDDSPTRRLPVRDGASYAVGSKVGTKTAVIPRAAVTDDEAGPGRTAGGRKPNRFGITLSDDDDEAPVPTTRRLRRLPPAGSASVPASTSAAEAALAGRHVEQAMAQGGSAAPAAMQGTGADPAAGMAPETAELPGVERRRRARAVQFETEGADHTSAGSKAENWSSRAATATKGEAPSAAYGQVASERLGLAGVSSIPRAAKAGRQADSTSAVTPTPSDLSDLGVAAAADAAAAPAASGGKPLTARERLAARMAAKAASSGLQQ